MRARAISVAIVAIFLGLVSYVELSPDPKLLPPAIPVVSSCTEVKPGMRRIREPGMKIKGREVYQFDAPIKGFRFSAETCADAPPWSCGIRIWPENSTAQLNLSWGGYMMIDRKPPDPILGPPENLESRRILDDRRRPVGGDSWGYWGQDERWRRVHLAGWVEAWYGSKYERDVLSYGSVHESDAALFDEIINSVCRTSPDQ